MVIASGLGAQLGLGEESTYGTPVTVTRFLEFNSEGLDADGQRVKPTARHGASAQGADDVFASGFADHRSAP